MRYISLLLLLNFLPLTEVISDNEGRLIISADTHIGRVNDLVFSSSNKLISVSEDKTIRIWDIDDYTSPRVLRPYAEDGFEGRIYAADISPDGRFLAIAGYFKMNEVRVIDLFNDQEVTALYGHESVVNSVKFNSEGTLLASAGTKGNILTWQIEDNGNINTTPTQILKGHKSSINDLTFFGESKVISCSDDGSVLIWFLEQRIEPVIMKLHIDKVNCIAVSKNTNYIMSGGNKGDLILWDSTGNYVKKYNFGDAPITSLDFTPSGKLIVGSQYLGILNSPNTDVQPFMPGAVRNVSSVVCHKNLIAYAWGNGNVGVHDPVDQETSLTIESSVVEMNKIGIGQNGTIIFGNNTLEKAFDYRNLQYLWNTFDRDQVKRGVQEDNGYRLIKMDEFLLSTGFRGKVQNDSEADGAIRSYCILNEDLIAVGSDHSLKLYSRGGDFVRELQGHNGSVKDMVYDDSQKLLFAVCGDYTLRAWHINSGINSFSLFISPTNEWISWTERGYYEASAGGEKYLGWQVDYSNDKLSDFYRSSTFQSSYHHFKNTEPINAAKNTSEQEDPVLELSDLPKVEWIEPKMYETETISSRFNIKARINLPSKMESLRILINGRPLPTKRGFKTYRVVGNEIFIEETIDLFSPVNEVQIFVKSEEVRLISETRVVKVTSDLKSNRGDQNSIQIVNLAQKPDLYLLSIGISEFERDEYNLNFADDDANSLSDVFIEAPKRIYNHVRSRKLLNESATKANVLDAFEWLADSVKTNDVACLFIASHGFNKDGQFFILPHDGNPKNLEETTVRWNELSSLLSSLPGKVIVFLDACHSGKLGSNFSQFTSFNTEAIRSISSEENGVIIMAASTGNEVALESDEWGHGAFSLALIEGLKEGKADIKKDGVIYLPELDFYVSERTIELTDGRQHPTTQKPSTISRLPIL